MNDFLWTDKSSEKWYVIYSEGHEGPYSLQYLETKIAEGLFGLQTRVWSEGLPTDMTLEAVLALASSESILSSTDNPPDDLPPLPDVDNVEVNDEEELEVKSGSSKKWLGVLVILLILFSLLAGGFYYLQEREKEISILRPQGMSLKVADKIKESLEFNGWDNPLFLKEFISEDYNTLWLASSSFHRCEIRAHFKSQKDKLLSLTDEEVEFEGVGTLQNHLTEFRKFDFVSGVKIIPGLYDMTIEAENCQWDGIITQVMNLSKEPESTYSAKMSVILYSNGVEEFRELLDRVVRKKLENAVKEQSQLDLFWQGIQEKLQTLLAVSLQIEQLFLDFTRKDPKSFNQNLPKMVKEYTEKFGQFLTSFVVSNSESFRDVNLPELKGISERRNYENEISGAARNIGYSSMKIIEDFQKLKNPQQAEINSFEERVKNEFTDIKNKINQKIIQVSDDRSLPLDEDPEVENPSEE